MIVWYSSSPSLNFRQLSEINYSAETMVGLENWNLLNW